MIPSWSKKKDFKPFINARLETIDEGIEVTPIQKGVKEKTLVATVKSHTQN